MKNVTLLVNGEAKFSLNWIKANICCFF
jgi:hypothetical protein